MLATPDIAGEGAGDVVGAFYHEHLKQLAAGVFFAGLEVEFGRLAGGIGGLDGDRLVDVAGVENTQGGDDFLGGSNGAHAIGVFRVEVASALEIDHQDTFRDNGRGRCFGDCADAYRLVALGIGLGLALRRVPPAGSDGQDGEQAGCKRPKVDHAPRMWPAFAMVKQEERRQMKPGKFVLAPKPR